VDALLPSLLLWLQIFHHVVTIASYSIVCLTRSVRPSVHPSGSLCLKFAPAYQLSLDLTWALRCAALLSHGGRCGCAPWVGALRCGTCRRLSWYACALIMLESTTPFGNFRYLMSKSDSKLTGKSSTLYTINAAVWVVSHLSHLIS
jgi:hypothetical protein